MFCILLVCFIYKELDKWFRSNFDVTIHLNANIARELKRILIKRDNEVVRQNMKTEKDLKKKAQQDNDSDDGDDVKPPILDTDNADKRDDVS